MRARKLLYDSFYSNNEKFSGVTSVNSLTSDLYYHYTDENGSNWKLSGNTAERASGLILEDSLTTSITVTPMSYTGITGDTVQLAVVNQNNVEVLSECTFSGTTGDVTVDSDGLVTLVNVATAYVEVTHPDISETPTTVTFEIE